MKTNVLTLILVLLVTIFVGVHFGGQPWTPTRIAAVVIGLPALALLVLARIQLGGSFSVRPKAQALVTHGLYSRIRNPIYLFGALAIAGIFLYMNQPLYLWLFVVLIPLQIYRARQEGRSSKQDSTSTGNMKRAPGSDKPHALRQTHAYSAESAIIAEFVDETPLKGR